MPLEQKRPFATWVIDNGGTPGGHPGAGRSKVISSWVGYGPAAVSLNAFVTGYPGFIGKRLVKYLAEVEPGGARSPCWCSRSS